MLKKNSKEQILLDSALEVFSEKGFEKATIDDIVNRAACGKGTFYRYFANKEELFEKLDERFLCSLDVAFKKNCKPELPPREYLIARMNTFLEVFSRNKKIGLIRFERDLRLTEEQRRESSCKILKHLFFMKNYLDDATRNKTIKNFNSETILMTILGAAHFYLFRDFKLGTPYTSKEIEATIDIIYYGVKPE